MPTRFYVWDEAVAHFVDVAHTYPYEIDEVPAGLQSIVAIDVDNESDANLTVALLNEKYLLETGVAGDSSKGYVIAVVRKDDSPLKQAVQNELRNTISRFFRQKHWGQD